MKVATERMTADPYKNGLLELVAYYADVDGIFEKLKTMSSIRSIVNAFYFVLLGGKEITAIENLEEPEKLRIWNMTEGSKKERIEQARAIHALETVRNYKP